MRSPIRWSHLPAVEPIQSAKPLRWISGIVRNPTLDLCPVVVNEWGNSQITSLENLSSDLGLRGNTTAIKCEVSFGDLEIADAQPYLLAIGLGYLSEELGAQTVWTFSKDGMRFVLPSSLLILGAFGASKVLKESMLSPSSVSLFGAFPFMGAYSVPSMWESASTMACVAARKSWMAISPSAAASWSSIYRNALDGRFDMRLPLGTLELMLSGHRIGQTIFATRVRVGSVSPSDVNLGMTQNSKLIFSPRAMSDWRATGKQPRGDARLASFRDWDLSQPQWEAVQIVLSRHFATNSRPARRPLSQFRGIVEMLRYKFATGCPFNRIPANIGPWSAAMALYSVLRKKDLWNEMVLAMSS